MPPPQLALMEEHVEEILLRFPPRQPAGLFRAALVCKRWCRLISSPGFRRRYREFHRTPRLIGFLSNGLVEDPGDWSNVSRFVPVTAFCWPRAETRHQRVLDARHGRVLLQHIEVGGRRVGFDERRGVRLTFLGVGEPSGEPEEGARGFFVSAPMTTEQREVPIPSQGLRTLAAAVLCADTTGACDHLDCQLGPFLVVFVGYHFPTSKILIYTYSSETATWNDPIPISAQETIHPARLVPSAYVGNALYFGFGRLESILKYDLRLGQISWIQLPTICHSGHQNVFITAEAGVLGLATMRQSKLYIWFRKDASPEVDAAAWTRTKIIDFHRCLSSEAHLTFRQPLVVGSTDGAGFVFFWANNVIYAVNLRSHHWIKFCNSRTVCTLFPYMTFYTPALGAACTGEGPSAGGSSA